MFWFPLRMLAIMCGRFVTDNRLMGCMEDPMRPIGIKRKDRLMGDPSRFSRSGPG